MLKKMFSGKAYRTTNGKAEEESNPPLVYATAKERERGEGRGACVRIRVRERWIQMEGWVRDVEVIHDVFHARGRLRH